MIKKVLVGAVLCLATSALAQDVLPDIPLPNGQEQSFRGYLTGYSFWDKSPNGLMEIAYPEIHDFAGGVGTYTDPITIAVGHVFHGPHDQLDFPRGTRFYLPLLRKYAIVEDSCDSRPEPETGPCRLGKDGLPWLDIYVDGASMNETAAMACMAKISKIQTFVMDPHPNYSVVVGELTQSGCFTFPDL